MDTNLSFCSKICQWSLSRTEFAFALIEKQKVLIGFVTLLLLFYGFGFLAADMWGLSSPARDEPTPCTYKGEDLTIGLPGSPCLNYLSTFQFAEIEMSLLDKPYHQVQAHCLGQFQKLDVACVGRRVRRCRGAR